MHSRSAEELALFWKENSPMYDRYLSPPVEARGNSTAYNWGPTDDVSVAILGLDFVTSGCAV